MTAFVRYQLISLIRSLKFIPPATLMGAWVFIMYAYKNVPILSSYGASAMAIYITTTWISMVILTLEEESEKHILYSHLGSKLKFLLGKWAAALVVMIPLLLFAIFYPIIADSFRGNMTFTLYTFAFYSHLVFVLFGLFVGTLFSATRFATKKYAWLSAVLAIVVSLASASIIEIVPIAKWVLWIFPPVFKVIDHMEGEDTILLKESLMTDVVFVIGYLLIGFTLNAILFRKKER